MYGHIQAETCDFYQVIFQEIDMRRNRLRNVAIMYFDQIVNSFSKDVPRQYSPRFHIRREDLGWRIFDGDIDIAMVLVQNVVFDIWRFSPWEEPIIHNTEPLDKVIDLHTMHNTYINMGKHGWPEAWTRKSGTNTRIDLGKESGEELEMSFHLTAPSEEECTWRFRICYDPDWHRYRFSWTIDARKRDFYGFEPFNLMAAGAVEDRAERRRWTHSVWESTDGQLRRFVHSNALFVSCDNWFWSRRNYKSPEAWVGYAANATFNPFVLVHKSNTPLRGALCECLFDEHILWGDAGVENFGSDGFFHFHMEVEVVNAGKNLAQQLMEQASDLQQLDKLPRTNYVLPFYVDRVNSFDAQVDLNKPEDCPIFVVSANSEENCAWDRNIGHADSFSLRLSGTAAGKRNELFTKCAVVRVKPRTSYRLSGWIRAESVEEFACLELSTYRYASTNIINTAKSRNVKGSGDWTMVDAVLDNVDDAYVLPKLVLSGKGTAWFDDLRIEEVH